MTPSISVVMPLYNAAPWLRRALDSVLAQTFTNFEVLCVNDGSTDETPDILQEYAGKDSRIKILQKENEGRAAKARNMALRHAKGDFFFPLDGDDWISENLFEKLIQRAKATGADVVICDLAFIYPDSTKNFTIAGVSENVGKDNKVIDRNVILDGRRAVELTLFGWRISAFALYSRNIYSKIHYYEEGTFGDEFSAREFFFNANKIAFSEGTYFYSKHKPQATEEFNPRMYDQHSASMRLFTFLKENGFAKLTIRNFVKEFTIRLFDQIEFFNKNSHLFPEPDRERVRISLKEASEFYQAHMHNF